MMLRCWLHALGAMPTFNGPAAFLESLKSAELTTGRHPLKYFATTGYRLIRHFAGLSPAGVLSNQLDAVSEDASNQEKDDMCDAHFADLGGY